MTKTIIAFCTTLLALAAGCAAPRNGALPHPRTLYNDIAAPDISPADLDVNSSITPAQPKGVLALNDALALALTHNPELRAFSYSVRAAEARTLQAGLLPNPELEVELEEFDRNGEGMNSSELVISLGQTIELGGKRRRRKRLANAEGDLAGWDYEEARLRVLAETTRRFTDAVIAERRLAQAESAVELARKLKDNVDARIAAGKEPQFHSLRAAAQLGLTELQVLEAGNGVAIARRRLAGMWSAPKATFSRLDGRIDNLPDALPSLEAVESFLPRNPLIARQDAELRLAMAALASERAATVPDLQMSVGFIRFEEDGTDALAFGVGTSLPVFDRNQGGIAAARYDLARLRNELQAARTTLALELAEAYAALTTAYAKARTLREKVLPATEKASGAAGEGYAQGKFGYVDVLDAQQSLFDSRIELLDTLADYHSALLTVEQLTGTPLQEINSKHEEKE